MDKNLITASIVTYNTAKKDLDNLRLSFLNISLDFTLYIVDNSSHDRLRAYFKNDKNVVYISNPSNPGFGSAHNIAIRHAISNGSAYHFVINPDVYFEKDVFSPMIDYMKKNEGVGMIMPQILNLDGSIQFLPKLLPSPLDIFLRKFKRPKVYYERFIEKYELRFVNVSSVYEAPILSGCFTLLNTSVINEVGMYDDKFFMYFEDWDLSRRIARKYKTIYYPKVSVFHGYDSGANRSKRLFKIFIHSAFIYFSKWGWFFDRERKSLNKKTLSQFK